MKTALIIGGGPAGLMAADVLSAAGHAVTIAEAKPSVARKFLMAGKSGLNLTKDEPLEDFMVAYGEAAEFLSPMIRRFDPDRITRWAEALGQEMFVGSTGRVFPKVMKASPLLRNWLGRLADQGVDIKTRYRWIGIDAGFVFETPDGKMTLTADVVVLACGGASWSRLGSDGGWSRLLDVPLAPFAPANMGFRVDWSPHMAKHFGAPVKGAELVAGELRSRGEFVISEQGIEGGGVYAVSRPLREGTTLYLDLLPEISERELEKRLSKPRGKMSQSNFLRKVAKLDPVKQALLMEFGRPLPANPAALIKQLPVTLQGPRPMDEAISTAGGIRLDALTPELMLSSMPGVFAAGEMLDWEAPTGGYLLTACLATGKWAGEKAADYLDS